MAKKVKQVRKTPRLSSGPYMGEMQREAPAGRHPFVGKTRTLKSMVKEVEEAGKTAELARAAFRKQKHGDKDYRTWKNSTAKSVMLEDRLEQILGNRVPERLGVEEFIKQIESGEAAIQNPRRTRRIHSSYFMGADPTFNVKKEQPKSNKKVPEFIMTTVREPKKLKKAMRKAAEAKARK